MLEQVLKLETVIIQIFNHMTNIEEQDYRNLVAIKNKLGINGLNEKGITRLAELETILLKETKQLIAQGKCPFCELSKTGDKSTRCMCD